MTIRLTDAAKHYKALSHQIAGWNWLQEQLTPDQVAEFAELYRADPPSKPAASADWVAPAIKIIKAFEGCELTAYPDPGTGGAPWTIGYGTTRLANAPVRKGDTITQAAADDLLRSDVEQLFGPGILHLLPLARSWRPEQVAALTSWAYNVGLAAVEGSTLRRRLLKGEDACTVVREELPKWRHAGEAVLAGLERRRAAEVALFCSAVTQQLGPLKVPYYSQRDSAIAGQAQRMCFSSSCAMLVTALRPGRLTGANGDDQYLQVVMQHGDSTDPQAQLKALAHYGISARFSQNCSWNDLEQQIAKGVPVPCGFLHHGPSTAPSGGGHWLIVIGTTPTAVIVNDPWGEMLVAEGRYAGNRGVGLAYSRRNWGPRWMVEGNGTGWAIIANP
jgi:GH24 family phage-related lysozyme (muramidase)